MVKLVGIFSHFQPIDVLVIGDLMLDIYTTGKVRRISPEAPVPILHVEKEEHRPGGAGNVVLNLLSLGAHVKIVGRLGQDGAGFRLKDELGKEGADCSGLLFQKDFTTPVKNRLIAGAQQILRVDSEDIIPLPLSLEDQLIKELPALLEDVQIVAISDYGKGFLSRRLLASIIQATKIKNIPILVDPKGDDFTKYAQATLIKPNLSEAYVAAKLPSTATLDEVAENILKISQTEKILITKSEAGMSLFERDGSRYDFPVRSKEVKDVTGAGDTVLAMLCMALGNQLDLKDAVQLSNVAAGMAIERLGCARITLSEMAHRLLEYDVINKIFDENHLFALSQALNDKRFTVLGLDETQELTASLFKSLKLLSSRDVDGKLIIYISDNHPDEEFISLLSSLSEVDFIVRKSESLQHLCDAICPHEVYIMENDQLAYIDHHSTLFDKLGC